MSTHPKPGQLIFVLATLCVANVLPAALASAAAPTQPATTQAASAPASQPIDLKLEAESYRVIIEALTDSRMQGRGPGSEGLDRARDYIQSRMQSAGLSPGVGESYLEPFPAALGKIKVQPPATAEADAKALHEGKGDIKLCDVVGVLSGSGDLKDQVVIVGAHYDHLGVRPKRPTSAPAPAATKPSSASSPESTLVMETLAGADDNASGTAGVLTLAKWAVDDFRRTQPASQRTIVFVAFSGEEIGLLGSAHMVKHLDDLGLSRDQIVAMLNFDMIGRLRDGKLQVLGVDSGDQWRDILDGVKLPEGMSLKLGSAGAGPSDHAVFNAQKIPVLHFFTGIHTDTHTVRDTPDKINCPGAVEVLQVAQQVLLEAARRRDQMAYQPTGGAGRSGPKSSKPYVGVVLAGADDRVKGCKVNDVNDDSPAKTAGLKSGDVITGWDDDAIKKVDDFFSKVEGAKAGQAVKLKIIRDGKEQTLDVKLEGQ